MVITNEVVRDQLLAYLNRVITLAQLVDWAEDALNEGELEAHNCATFSTTPALMGKTSDRRHSLPTITSITCELCKIP